MEQDLLTASVQCISLGEYSDHEKIEEHEVKRGMFRAKVSLWPGLSGGPAIPMAQNFVENRLFIGMGIFSFTFYFLPVLK